MPNVGAGKAEIDLEGVLPFDGFDEQLDAIWARALVVEAGTRCCVVSVEATSLRGDLVDLLRDAAATASSCPREATWICATHTFSVPHVRTPDHLADDEERTRNERLREALVGAVEKAACDAAGSLCDATLSVACGVTVVNVNRDVDTPAGWWIGTNPEGYSDHGIRALVARGTDDGATLAVVFSADVQSSVLQGSRDGEGRRLVTGDLVGRAATHVESSSPGCVALFLEGAAADQAPTEQAVMTTVARDGSISRSDKGGAGLALLDRLGIRLGEDVSSALAHATSLDCRSVEATEVAITCPGQRRADFASLRPDRDYSYQAAPDVATTMCVLRLGDLVLLGVAPEIPSSLGTLVRTGYTTALVDILTLVNGAEKYLPAQDAYERRTYEAMNSGFGEGSAEALLRAAIETVNNALGSRGNDELGDRL